MWPRVIPGVEIVDARSYLINDEFSAGRGTIIFNLCRSYRYQNTGYYVSLLAEARGHRPLPDVTSIQDLKSSTMLRYVADELEDVIEQSLHALQSKQFTLSIYFGKNLAKRYERLSRQLFKLFNAPLMRAYFERKETWELRKITPIGANEIPEDHWDFVVDSAKAYFARPRYAQPPKVAPRYFLAILHNPEEELAPSDEDGIRRFEKAAEKLRIETELIQKDDYGRLNEFDALFIRETTRVNHHTYRFSRRAFAEGLEVIDDPQSILKCTNKVYLAELLNRYRIRAPKTVIVHKENLDTVIGAIGLPCILKQPDSSFSQGVVKAETPEELEREAGRLLDKSDLIVAQEFIPTTFDWRVGIIDRQPLFVCRYHMARKHWQIQKTGHTGRTIYGKVDTLAVEDAPPGVVRTALKAANLIGDGLYGVDLKEYGRKFYVIEVNDNPSIDGNVEDTVLKEELYDRIMGVFLKRLEHKKHGRLAP